MECARLRAGLANCSGAGGCSHWPRWNERENHLGKCSPHRRGMVGARACSRSALRSTADRDPRSIAAQQRILPGLLKDSAKRLATIQDAGIGRSVEADVVAIFEHKLRVADFARVLAIAAIVDFLVLERHCDLNFLLQPDEKRALVARQVLEDKASEILD